MLQFSYAVEDNFLITSDRRRLLRRERFINRTDMSLVRDITWYISAFSQPGTIRIQLWNDNDCNHIKENAGCGHELPAIIRRPDFIYTEAHETFTTVIQPAIDSGLVRSTIDLGFLSPVAPGR